jgi:hypothetical protein
MRGWALSFDAGFFAMGLSSFHDFNALFASG